MSEYKNLKLIDPNLLSGSTESFRTAAYHCWYQASETLTVDGVEIDAGDQIAWPAILATYNASAPDLALVNIYDQIETNIDRKEEISSETILPNYRFPLRFTGDSTNFSTDGVENDEDWKEFVLAVYNNNTFDDHGFTYELPYGASESKNLDQITPGARNPITISYKYNFYLPEYEEHIAGLETPLSIPNYDLLTDVRVAAWTDQQADLGNTGPDYESPQIMTLAADAYLSRIDEDMVNFVSLDGTVSTENLASLLSSKFTNILPPHFMKDVHVTADGYYDDTHFLHNYLTDTYVNATAPTGGKLQNICFDNSEAVRGHGYGDVFPFYIEIDLPIAQESSNTIVRDSITTNDFDPQIIKMIKEIFGDETATITPSTLSFSVAASYQSGSVGSSTVTSKDIDTVSTHAFRSVDLINSLAYYYNNYLSYTEDDSHFMGYITDAQKAALDTIGTYRYDNTKGATGVMKDLLDKVTTDSDYIIESLDDLYMKAEDSKYRETIVYRIEKRNASGTTLQNFWIFNSTGHVDNINFIDTQIKYGEAYTYRVYAYVVVIGHKYNFSDLAITRAIAPLPMSPGADTNCLEFYDPATGDATPQLFDETTLAATNQYATEAQITSDKKYLADFYLNYEPTIKLIEIPIYSKTLSVLDHSSPALEAIPFQYMDDSQRIGFTLAVDTSRFTKHYGDGAQDALPVAITAEDQTLWTNYANSNNLLANEEVSTDSVSRIQSIEIYRIDKKPTAYTDFADNQLSIISLRTENVRTTVSKTRFIDKIRVNKKYYYLFRGLNEHGIPTHASQIYEAQLIDDGGYKYSLFDVVHKEDFDTSIYVNPSSNFKKLFHLKPNLSHLVLDTSNMDYTNTAAENLEGLIVGTADELIWDKIFKIRLTSKKTGKRIDLNITYNLENE